MTTIVPIRPIAEIDLNAIRIEFQEKIDRWALAWLADAVPHIISLATCSLAELGEDVDARTGVHIFEFDQSVLLITNGEVTLWLGRQCVINGERSIADTRIDDVLTELGRAALNDLVSGLAGVDGSAWSREIEKVEIFAHASSVAGVLLRVQIGEVTVSAFFPRQTIVGFMARLKRPSAKLKPVTLPKSLGKAKLTAVMQSAAFEMFTGDLLRLDVGDVVTLDQPLNAPFQLRLAEHPELSLKAYAGKMGETLAVEVFGKI